VLICLSTAWVAGAAEPRHQPLSVVVMDPLAAPLSCPCVEGYAQRKYEKLAEYLQQALGRPVKLTFSESLRTALEGKAEGRADLIIGKHSVVRADAKAAGVPVTAVASLTGKDGATTQTGLFVVPAADPATKVGDLSGYRIFFGTSECDEKYAAAIALLRSAGVPVPEKPETSAACSDGACKTLDLGAGVRAAAVISSYAKPLLEGCGTVKKGDLRVIGETKPVPFITAFVSDALPGAERDRLSDALLAAGTKPDLCSALETLLGFVPIAAQDAQAVKKK
jgi:ABC-type phosphate/phosphonate transport system substrate-binding protein